MAAAGLIVEGIFSAAGLIPHHRATTIVATSFHWNYTAILNIVFLAVFAYLYWLYRNRERLGGGAGYALDPVCGMQVRTANAPAHVRHDGADWWFCSDHCAQRFSADPQRYNKTTPEPIRHEHLEETTMATDPVCGMNVDPGTAAAVRSHEGRNYFFCATGCAQAFDADPERYLSQEEHAGEH
jgi:YHS domain-containing protein